MHLLGVQPSSQKKKKRKKILEVFYPENFFSYFYSRGGGSFFVLRGRQLNASQEKSDSGVSVVLLPPTLSGGQNQNPSKEVVRGKGVRQRKNEDGKNNRFEKSI